MRLAANEKMGFYPTDSNTLSKIMTLFTILDPCCGDGIPLDVFKSLGCHTYGIELNEQRAKTSLSKGHTVLEANALYGVNRSYKWTGLLFLNPPYMANEKGFRSEVEFVRQYKNHIINAQIFS